MVDERPRLAASEIDKELFAELQKLPTPHDTQSVAIRHTAPRRVGRGSCGSRAPNNAWHVGPQSPATEFVAMAFAAATLAP